MISHLWGHTRKAKLLQMIPTTPSHPLFLQHSEVQTDSRPSWELKTQAGKAYSLFKLLLWSLFIYTRGHGSDVQTREEEIQNKPMLLCLPHYISWAFKGWIWVSASEMFSWIVLTHLPEMNGIWAGGGSSPLVSAKGPQIPKPED